MAKNLIIDTEVIVAIAAALAWLNRDAILFALIQSQMAPERSFADTTAPDAPDYANLDGQLPTP